MHITLYDLKWFFPLNHNSIWANFSNLYYKLEHPLATSDHLGGGLSSHKLELSHLVTSKCNTELECNCTELHFTLPRARSHRRGACESTGNHIPIWLLKATYMQIQRVASCHVQDSLRFTTKPAAAAADTSVVESSHGKGKDMKPNIFTLKRGEKLTKLQSYVWRVEKGIGWIKQSNLSKQSKNKCYRQPLLLNFLNMNNVEIPMFYSKNPRQVLVNHPNKSCISRTHVQSVSQSVPGSQTSAERKPKAPVDDGDALWDKQQPEQETP